MTTRILLLTLSGLLTQTSVSPGLQDLPAFTLAVIDRAGASTTLGRLPAGAFAPRVSNDGRRVAFDTMDGGIWIADLANIASPRRVGSGRFPIWTTGDSHLLTSGPDGTRLFLMSADGSGSAELITDAARAPESWSTRLSLATYITLIDNGDYDIWTLAPSDKSRRPLVVKPRTAELSSQFSPDGRWLAYQSNESGAHEVYVEPFPLSGARQRVSSGGGMHPVWSSDGREIFFDLGEKMYAAPFDQAAWPNGVTPPRVLPVSGFVQGTGRRLWDLTRDGRFLVLLR